MDQNSEFDEKFKRKRNFIDYFEWITIAKEVCTCVVWCGVKLPHNILLSAFLRKSLDHTKASI